MAWAWRSRTQKLWRIIVLIVVTAILMIGFWIASVFSSQIATTSGDEVLVTGNRCGVIAGWNFPNLEDYYKDYVPYSNEIAIASAAYAQQCYVVEDEPGNQQCFGYVKSQLPMTVLLNASCPFPGRRAICLRETSNVHIDTGIIDSHRDLGVNAPPSDRVGIRFTHQCAPLKTKGYTQQKKSSKTTGVDNILEYLYGGRVAQVGNTNTSSQVTYEYPIQPQRAPNGDSDFSITCLRDYAGEAFYPIPEIGTFRSDSEDQIFQVFVSSNSVDYVQEVDDDLFSAHQLAPPLVDENHFGQGNIPVFHADQPAGVLGCVWQFETCNQHANVCVTNTGGVSRDVLAQQLHLNERQYNTMNVLLNAFLGMDTSIEGMLANPVTTSLLARNKLTGSRVGPLPRNQWQQEVVHWQASALARWQRVVLEQFTGPSDESVDKYVNRTMTSDQQSLCQNQKIRSNAYTSFSVLGLSITLILGSFIIFLSFTIDRILRFTQRWHNYGVFQRLEWISNETLQLQRMAHEELGCGTWIGTERIVPVTEKDETLALLDVKDRAHPSLTRQPDANEDNKIKVVEAEVKKEE
ncbi:MAG: hypothetical protein Q9227_003637 [Pyrenula ochraceoflavens]